jgi:hypothetical protein
LSIRESGNHAGRNTGDKEIMNTLSWFVVFFSVFLIAGLTKNIPSNMTDWGTMAGQALAPALLAAAGSYFMIDQKKPEPPAEEVKKNE